MTKRQPGRERLEDALLRLLKTKPLSSITVTELCKAANVSRSTFYVHFANVADVYRDLVRQLIFGTSAMRAQLRGAGTPSPALGRPLCHIVRHGEEQAGLVNDDAFIPTYLELSRTEFDEAALGIYLDACHDRRIAQALFCFQIMGCIAAARSVEEHADWDDVKVALDAFIRGGLNAVRNLA